MWEALYQDRLTDWHKLRQAANTLNQQDQLLSINNWWFCAPIINRVITWDDPAKWPAPWELLNNKGYCELARALGIVYTIMLVDNRTYTNLKIIQTEKDNLVLVDDGKYILNWAPGEMLNTHSAPIPTVKNMIDSSKLESFLQ
jgi:hypothetical protein